MKAEIYEIAIITDSNRSDLRVVCNWKKENNFSFESPLKTYRYVWIEHFQDVEKAEIQLKHIHTFARIQLEKVIRRQNPILSQKVCKTQFFIFDLFTTKNLDLCVLHRHNLRILLKEF